MYEYPGRIARARELMKVYDLAGLMLTAGSNLVYFIGASGPLAGHNGSRPSIYLLPLEGDPVLIVQDGPSIVARATGIVDIRPYTRLSHLPKDTLMKAMRDRHLLHGKIGAELGGEMSLDLPFGEFARFQEEIPMVEFIDASPLLWELRRVKSEAEISRIARACEITSQSYEMTFKAVRPGMTENQVEQIHRMNMMALGGGTPWSMILSGSGNYDLIGKNGVDRIIEPGDLIWIDSGCAVEGYWSDFSRAGVVGGPTPQQEEAQQRIHEITMLGVNMVRPGISAKEIAARCYEALEAFDFPITSSIAKLAARVGHGIGLDITELPSINQEDPAILEPGMVISIEPGIATEFGTFHIEENVLVAQDGHRLLSSPDWQLWTIPL